MSATDLMARIEQARSGYQKAKEMLGETRDFPDVGEGLENAQNNIVGEVFDEFGDPFDEVGDALENVGEVLDEVGDVLDGVGEVLDDIGEVFDEVGLGGVGDEFDFAGEAFDAAGEVLDDTGEVLDDVGEVFDSEGGIPAPRPGDPEPADGVRVPGLDSAYYGSSPPGQGNAADTAYDERVTGSRPGLGVYLENPTAPSGKTEFDWIEYAPNGEITLLDAKNAGENSIYNSEFGREIRAVPQAQRQITAIEHSGIDREDVQIEWRVASEETAQALQETFRDRGIDITVVHKP
ncbi:hypothetical protein ACKFKG_12115 [Phormidesmis sp. 146-35]